MSRAWGIVWRGAWWRLGCLVLVGCTGGEGGAMDAGAPDADAGFVREAGSDAEHDAGAVCPSWTVRVAGTTDTDALAGEPARCGQPAFTWRRDEGLGDIVDAGTSEHFTPRQLEALATAAGITLPVSPGEPVGLRVMRFVTQDRGESLESTALLAYPSRASGAPRGFTLLLHGTSGFTAGCGVSSEAATRFLAALLASAMGRLVVAPDYLGLEPDAEAYGGRLHPYLVGQATAIVALDAVRAAAKMAPALRGGDCVEPTLLVLGGSQGGHAALWVDRLAPYYARELDLLGTVATVPPADLLGQVRRASLELVDATANSIAFFATASSWYGFADRLNEVFVAPWDVQAPRELSMACRGWDLPMPHTTSDVFQQALIDAARADRIAEWSPWGCMVAENGLTSTSVARIGPTSESYGVLFVTGERDPLVHTPIEREAFRNLCEEEMPVRYLECAGADHGGGTAWALPEILDFLAARARREPFVRPRTCEPPPPTRCRGTPEGR